MAPLQGLKLLHIDI